MKQKINLRLFLIALIAVIAATVSLTVVYYNLFVTQVRGDLAANAALLADTGLFQGVYAASGEGAEPIDTEALSSLSMDNLRITWIAPDGTVLYDNDTDASSLPNHLERPEIQDAIANGSGESIRQSETLKLNTFYYALCLSDGTILRVSTQAHSITSIFLTAVPVIIGLIILILALCVLLGHLLTIQLIRPIDKMAEHLDDQIDTQVYRELAPFAEKIRSQHEKILEASRSRQDFTANISHELKTPLTAISGYAELIENRMIDAEQEVHIAEQIRHNAERLLSLINDIIRLSELDHRELPRSFTRIDLMDIAKECCDEQALSAEKKRLVLSCSGESASLSGDRDLVKELADNLIQNAIRYNREGGYVRVTVREVNGHAVLNVADNGIGIPRELQERVFERFFRVDKGRSRETGGTGLGLAIVKHIAEIHNASISLQSEPGHGTTITVSF